MFNTDQMSYGRLRSIVRERTNPIMIWLGSGLSSAAGMPSWLDLRNNLCRALEDKARYAPTKDQADQRKRLAHIKAEGDLWLAFSLLRDALGDTSYVECIKESFAAAPSCSIPAGYEKVISLPFSGIINLNIDRLATRTYSLKNPGKCLVEFSGRQCGDFVHILKGGHQFIANLHGTVEDRSSWVLTRQDLNWLTNQPGYTEFVKSILCTRTVIFIGVRTNDIAVGGHLEKLKKMGVDFGTHFWITDKSDKNTDRWAESAGVLLIRYNSSNEHIELSEMLTDIATFFPEDQPAAPVLPNIDGADEVVLPSAEQLERMSDEDIRIALNKYAEYILRDGSKESYRIFDEFCERYDRYVYRSWYITTKAPSNIILGYRLEQQIAEGAFGRVFKAIDAQGDYVALKLLKQDVRRKPEMLQGFRRGVQSMRILDKHSVAGMIPYRNSSEIPALVVMDLVDGPNLHEAVESGYCKEWSTILRTAVDLCKIIRTAHQLPERVLHRDIRPANVMFRHYYTDPENYEVVVLDFDLSWYRGSQEVSILGGSTMNGFLAPEQIERIPGTSTRSAAVDSFGLGMTLYYLRSQKEPLYMEHRHRDWRDNLYNRITAHGSRKWVSVPIRFARLIEMSTKDIQSARWDCSQILGELQRLQQAEVSPSEVSSAELVAEELAYSTCMILGQPDIYCWDIDAMRGALQSRSGVKMEFIGNESKHKVCLGFYWSNMGATEYKNVRKYLKPYCEAATSQLSKIGFICEEEIEVTADHASFSMSIDVKRAVADISNMPKSLADVFTKFRFS